MKIALPWEQFNDDEGRPLVAGRVSVYKHDSDIPADIYTLEGDTYVAAQNPFLTADDGRIPTIWFEASVVDIRLEKRNADGTYEPLDTFQAGFEMPKASNSTFVYGMSELKDVSPDVGIVTVVGYYSEYDAPSRNYVWDPNCSLDPDGGVIVESNTGEEGRWILLWDDEYLPSSLYGVFAGTNEANISAFINYPDFVGTYRVRTSPIPRFLGGDYTTEGALITARSVYFDVDARFSSAEIECKSAIIPENSSYVAEFYFTGKNVTAHSSWFKSIDAFLTCNADQYIVDPTNYFLNKYVKLKRIFENKTFVYTSNTRLPITYTNSGRLEFNKCTLVGSRMFDGTDLINFVYTDFRDDWFSNVNIDFQNNVSCRSVSLNTIRLDNFKNTMNYINALKYDGVTTVDLAGRKVGSWTNDFATEVRNVFADHIGLAMPGSDMTIVNVHCPDVAAACRYLTITGGSDVSFGYQPNISALWCYDSRFNASYPWSNNAIQCIFQNCWISAVFNYAQNNESAGSWLEFVGCTFQENCAIRTKYLKMRHCTTENATIQIYPYKVDDEYHMYVDLENNLFHNSSPIEFTKLKVDGYEDENVGNIIVNWTITNNTFIGNSEGLRCRYWQYHAGQQYNKLFIAFSMDNQVTYFGNTGNCPQDTAKGLTMNNGGSLEPSTVYYVEMGDDNYVTLFKSSNVRLMPNIRSSGNGAYHWSTNAINGNGLAYRYHYDGNHNYTLNQSGGDYIYPWDHVWSDILDNGDFFLYGWSKWGKIERHSGYPGNFWIWYYG